MEEKNKTCSTCRFGAYNDHWDSLLCNNPNSCKKWNLWEEKDKPVKPERKSEITISPSDYGTLVICALRYCHGRQTYMPSMVQDIVAKKLEEINDRDLYVIRKDLRDMNDVDYGDVIIDKPDWLKFADLVEKEYQRRHEAKMNSENEG